MKSCWFFGHQPKGSWKPHSLDAGSELADASFLLYPKRSNVRHVIDQFFKELNVSPRVTMEADDTEAIKRLVESGFGCSILPAHALREQSCFL